MTPKHSRPSDRLGPFLANLSDLFDLFDTQAQKIEDLAQTVQALQSQVNRQAYIEDKNRELRQRVDPYSQDGCSVEDALERESYRERIGDAITREL